MSGRTSQIVVMMTVSFKLQSTIVDDQPGQSRKIIDSLVVSKMVNSK